MWSDLCSSSTPPCELQLHANLLVLQPWLLCQLHWLFSVLLLGGISAWWVAHNLFSVQILLLLGFFFLKKHVTNHPFPHYLLGHLQWSKHSLKSWYLFTCSMKERPCLFHSQYSPIVLNGAWHVEGVWQIFVEWIHELDKLGLGLDHLGGSPSSNEALWFSKSITKSIHLSSWELLPVYWPR